MIGQKYCDVITNRSLSLVSKNGQKNPEKTLQKLANFAKKHNYLFVPLFFIGFM
jgi:hypothetical protein